MRIDRLGQEWREALRALRRAPGHSLACVALLAIGIASATAILTVGDGLLRRPLPVEDGERLVVPFGTRGSDERVSASAIDAEAWRQAPSLAGLAVARPQAATVERDGEAERVGAARVEAGYLPLLGVRPLLGRGFDEAEARSGARLALLGFGLWQRRFGGDPDVLGRPLRIDGEDWEIAGVLPRGFDLPLGSQLWRPLHLDAVPADRRDSNVYDAVARLAPGRSLEQARTELELIGRRLAAERPETNAGWGVGVTGLRRYLLDDPEGSLEQAIGLVFWGAVLLLLIACADVAQMQVVRAVGRLGEMGTRLALGGSRASLARMLILEAVTLAFLAAALSVPLAFVLAGGLIRLSPAAATAFSGHLLALSWEPRILGAVAAGALATGLLTGAYPAWRIARTDVVGLLSGGLRASADRRRRAVLELAVVAQLAIAVALLSAAGALGESYALLRGVDVGFREQGLSYYELSLAAADYPEHERRAAFAEALVESLRETSGVEGVAFTTNVPLAAPTSNWIAAYGCEGRELAPGEVLITADRLVGSGYLETLGVRLIAGRTLSPTDTAGTEPVAVVSHSLADDCWPGQAAVGRRVLRRTRSGWLPMTVVGVVADPQEQRVSFRSPHRAWYLPYRQHAFLRDLNLLVRGRPAAAEVRALVRRLNPHQPVSGPRRLSEHLDEATGSDRMAALVMGYFTVVGLLLAAFGVRGSLQRFVAHQRRAIGTRMALGAGPGRITASLLARGVTLAGIGVAIGVAGALALEPVTASFVRTALVVAPLRIAVTAGAILALAAAACATTAIRAGRIDPSRLLRSV